MNSNLDVGLTTIDTLIEEGRIKLTGVTPDSGYPQDKVQDVKDALVKIYSTPFGLDMFASYLENPENVITISYLEDGAAAQKGLGKVGIDPDFSQNAVYIDKQGRAVQEEFAGTLAHELTHALAGFDDFPSLLKYSSFSGETVEWANFIFEKMDMEPQLSYLGSWSGSSSSEVVVGQDYSWGVPITRAWVDRSTGDSTVTIEVIRRLVAADNSSNDLIFGSLTTSIIDGGGGNDVIYGAGNDETLIGGTGRDRLEGGEGSDTLRGGKDGDYYFASARDTIIDDGVGDSVFFDGVKLGTAKRSRGEDCIDQKPGARETISGDVFHTNDEGWTFKKVQGGLDVINSFGEVLFIQGWGKNGDYGISLIDTDPRTGDPCDIQPYDYNSPLVLDLDLDGLEITSVSGNSVYFDIDNDGIRERTAWVSSDDGLLVLDRNDNGTIDNGTELFGYGNTYAPDLRDQSLETYLEGNGGAGIEFTSGFDQLAVFDLNADGVINYDDAVYNELRVWRDLNNDGISQAEEMFGLAELDIASISVDAVRDVRDENGSQGTDYSTFTYGDGRVSTIADIWFQFDQYDSQFDPVENISDEILALPDTFGAGDVDSLRNTMAQDATLAAMVADFAEVEPTDFGSTNRAIHDIIFRWAGVSPNAAFYRGAYADGREVATMEAFADTDFDQWGYRNPLPEAGAVLSEQYDVVHRNVTAELVLQTEWGATLFPELSYDRGSITLDPEANYVEVLANIEAGAPEGIVEKAAYYNFMLRIYDKAYGSFTNSVGEPREVIVNGATVTLPPLNFYVIAVENLLAREGLAHSYDDFLMAKIGSAGADDAITDSWAGNQYSSEHSIVVGGDGDDTLIAGGSGHTIYYSKGDGNDTLSISQFSSAEWTFTPRIVLKLTDINLNEVEFDRTEGPFSRDLALKIIETGEALILRDFLDVNETRTGIIQFADGASLTFNEVEQIAGVISETGTENGEIILQAFGTVLTGAGGDDLLQGAKGDTTYAYEAGDGNDEIVDFAGDGENQISFGSVASQDDISFSREGKFGQDLVLTFLTSGEEITVRDQYLKVPPVINSLVFDLGDGTTENYSAGAIRAEALVGSDGDETLHGSADDDRFLEDFQRFSSDGDNATINTGNDVKSGYNGSDTYFYGQGSGNDIIRDKGYDRNFTIDGDNFDAGVDKVVFQQYLSELTVSRVGKTFTFLDNVTGETLVVENGRISGGLSTPETGQGDIELFGFGYNPDRGTVSQELTLDAMYDYIDSAAFIDERPIISGSSDDDVLIGTNEDEVIIGAAGNDQIDGVGGADLLQGNEGDDTLVGGFGDDVLNGAAGNDTLYGDEGDDELNGDAGNDTLYGGAGNDIIQGGTGNDIYYGETGDDVILDSFGATTVFYELGDGNDVVLNSGSTLGLDVFNFGEGITLSDLSYEFVDLADISIPSYIASSFGPGWGVKTTLFAGTLNEATVVSAIDAVFNGRNLTGFDTFKFADFTSIAGSTIVGQLRTATDADQIIVGTYEDDFITGGAGNDKFYGLGGEDTYVIRLGDDSDVIVDYGSSSAAYSNSIKFEGGISANDLVFSRIGDNFETMVISTTNGDQVTISGQFENVYGSVYSNSLVVGEIYFDDGSSLSFQDIESIATLSTDGDDQQIGSEIADYFVASQGDDTMIGQFGSDSYAFGIGSGSDIIIETDQNKGSIQELGLLSADGGRNFDALLDRHIDTLVFGEGVTLADLIVNASGSSLSDMTIQIVGTDDSLEIVNQLNPNGSWGTANRDYYGPDPDAPDDGMGMGGPGGSQILIIAEGEKFTQETWDAAVAENSFGQDFGADPLHAAGIENFTFTDGSSYTREEFSALTLNTDNSGDNALSTGVAGGVLDGGAGDDTLAGGTGADTYVFGYDYDSDTARDAGGFDQLQFTDTVEAQLISFRRVGENGNDLIIELGGQDRNSMLVENQFAGSQFRIEEFKLADGSTWTADQVERYILSQEITEGSDTIRDFNGATIINARGGDDRIILQSGSDLIDGGSGRDTIVLSGSQDQYQITVENGLTYIEDLEGTSGIKTVVNVEVIEFSNSEGDGISETVDLVANVAPTSVDLQLDGREDNSIIILPADLIALGSDPDGTTLRLVGVQNAVNGNVAVNLQGKVVFTPTPDFYGVASFEYTIADSEGAEVSGSVSIQVDAVNDRAVVGADDATGAIAGVSTIILAVDLLANDTDVDGDTLSIASIGDVTNGTAFIDTDGNISFIAADGFSGNALIEYFVTDGTEAVEAYLLVAVEPGETNSAPTIANALLDQSFAEDGQINFVVPADTFADAEEDVLALSAKLSDGSDLPDWLLFDSAAGTFLGTPPANYNGSLDVTVTASDGELEVSDQFTINVTAINDAPTVATPLADISFDEDTFIDFTIPEDTFGDVDGDTLTLTAALDDGTALPAWLVFDTVTRTFTGTPPADYAGALNVAVTATDGEFVVSDVFSIDIEGINDAPIIAEPLSDVSFAEDAAISFALPVTAFSDVDGDTLTLIATLGDGSPLPEWLGFDGNSRLFTGNPPANFSGILNVRVTASDGEFDVTDTFSISVSEVNDAPLVAAPLVDQSFDEDALVEFTIPDGTFSDVDNDTLSLTATLLGGAVLPEWLSFDGVSFSGQPPENFNGALDITVTASDGELSVGETFRVELSAVNDAPVVVSPLLDLNSDEDMAIDIAVPVGSFADIDGDALELTATLADGSSLPEWLAFDGNRLIGTPPTDFTGSIDIRLTANDGELDASDIFRLTIDPVNDAPVLSTVLVDQSSDEDEVVNFTIPSSAFTDVDGDTLMRTATLAGGATLPVWLAFDGTSFAGTPPANFNGSFDVIVTASDGEFEVSDQFTVVIQPINDAPTVDAILADQSFAEDMAVTFVVPTDAFSDLDGDELSLSATLADGSALPTWLSFNGTTFTGTPPQDFNGALDINVTASDSALTADQNFTLTIDALNDGPVANDDSGYVAEATGGSIIITASSVLANDTDVDGDTLEVTGVTAGNGGSVELNDDGDIVFTPQSGFVGEASFIYTASDGQEEDTASVSVIVEGNDDPYDGWTQGTDGTDFLFGNYNQSNQIYGAGGNDLLVGGRRNDELDGGDGNDVIFGGRGNDTITGGKGNDLLIGGSGRDTFTFKKGDGRDAILDFSTGGHRRYNSGGDKIVIDIEGVDSFDDLMALASQSRGSVSFDFGDGDSLILAHTRLAALDEDAFTFV